MSKTARKKAIKQMREEQEKGGMPNQSETVSVRKPNFLNLMERTVRVFGLNKSASGEKSKV